ncbi:AarF/ABC1/UbiB kinase family protein [Bacillus sp. DNRA2]|uniref:ABC1 kinase family protein n=1 Tax=Bacillus sp. DNRA2 TaxID=2723053 RepID=UPI00145E1AA9|nr:AarF/ABC1/UbiB kinase family protein [Bacillus sp. DNRA2]NMD69867.1 AarF/ABC1/UbiB kinase family protein [Bacillus sp. DNRA2]
MFRKRIRHMQRYREIVYAFIRYGFGYIIKDLGLIEILSLPKRLFVEVKTESHSKSMGERIRLFLQELGPTFVKIGQVASTRYDLLPVEIIEELEKLQDDAPHFDYEKVVEIIEEELGHPLDDVFQEFSQVPLAAASIGQVHFAVLKTGERVAVKIQRPNMQRLIETDLEILHDIALLAEQRLAWAAHYQIRDIVDEFSRSLLEEIDYTIEGRNAERIAKQFEKDSKVLIPKVYWDFSTKKVLTMEFVEGTKVNELEKLKEKGNSPTALAKRIVDSILHQILIEGYFHGDPHPGNILALPDDSIIYLDFGMVGKLTPDMKYNMASLVIALMRQRTDDVIKSITHMGIVPDDINLPELRSDVEKLNEQYYNVALSQTSLGQVVNDLFLVAYRHSIRIPSDLTLLGKTLLTMEGIVVKLDPEISILKIAEPFGKRLLMERFYPKKVAGDFWNQLVNAGELLVELPKGLKELTMLFRNGKMRQELSIPELELLLTKLNNMSNRISYSLGLLSFSIIMLGLILGASIAGQHSWVLTKLPIVDMGLGVGGLMFLFLLFLIYRSRK